MKKNYYESPTVEVVDVKVEGGFQLSGGKAGFFGYDADPTNMTEEDSY